MKVYNVVFVWTKNERGNISTNVRQHAYRDNEVNSVAEAVGKFLMEDFKNNMGWSIHCWSCNEIDLTAERGLIPSPEQRKEAGEI